MKYDFDEMIDRTGSHSEKLDDMPKGTPENSLAMWVADMDFACAPEIIEALHRRIDERIFGYTIYDNIELKDAVTGWYSSRYDWDIEPDSIYYAPGVVTALACLIRVLTDEGDGVIIQYPVYYPFTQKIEGNHRRVAASGLIYENGTYRMDFEDLERKFSNKKNKGMILCSPHNPVGRVWNKQELTRLFDIAKKYDKWIISDEIHSDLTRIGIKHEPLGKIAGEEKNRVIICTAPSKSFNLAGMQFSNIIIPNPEYRKLWENITADELSIGFCGPIGMCAAIAAYTKGAQWLDEARAYIDGNIDYVRNFVKENLPEAKLSDCQGTYLLWLDLKGYGYGKDELERRMHEIGHIALDEGYIFGEGGEGFERINVATPRANVEECMKRIKKALELPLN